MPVRTQRLHAPATRADGGADVVRAGATDAAETIAGFVTVRGGGVPVEQRRLPRRAPATIGRRERHAYPLSKEWAPRDLASFEPVREGWLLHSPGRLPMRVESDWLRSGETVYSPGAVVMLQRGDHRLGWIGLSGELSVSVNVRTRRLEDHRVPYAVDSAIDPGAAGVGSYLGVEEAALSASLRYRMAVLFRHLLEGTAAPSYLLRARAEFLGMPEGDLEWAAHRLRRRLNVVRDLDLQSIEELGHYLVYEAGELTLADLHP